MGTRHDATTGATGATPYTREAGKGKGKITLKAFKARFTVGATFICVENTYRPVVNGTRRTVTKVQNNGVFVRCDGVADRYWMPFPRACDIVEADAGTAKYKFGAGDHTLTITLPEVTA